MKRNLSSNHFFLNIAHMPPRRTKKPKTNQKTSQKTKNQKNKVTVVVNVNSHNKRKTHASAPKQQQQQQFPFMMMMPQQAAPMQPAPMQPNHIHNYIRESHHHIKPEPVRLSTIETQTEPIHEQPNETQTEFADEEEAHARQQREADEQRVRFFQAQFFQRPHREPMDFDDLPQRHPDMAPENVIEVIHTAAKRKADDIPEAEAYFTPNVVKTAKITRREAIDHEARGLPKIDEVFPRMDEEDFQTPFERGMAVFEPETKYFENPETHRRIKKGSKKFNSLIKRGHKLKPYER
jgi:hypothetical protein